MRRMIYLVFLGLTAASFADEPAADADWAVALLALDPAQRVVVVKGDDGSLETLRVGEGIESGSWWAELVHVAASEARFDARRIGDDEGSAPVELIVEPRRAGEERSRVRTVEATVEPSRALSLDGKILPATGEPPDGRAFRVTGSEGAVELTDRAEAEEADGEPR